MLCATPKERGEKNTSFCVLRFWIAFLFVTFQQLLIFLNKLSWRLTVTMIDQWYMLRISQIMTCIEFPKLIKEDRCFLAEILSESNVIETMPFENEALQQEKNYNSRILEDKPYFLNTFLNLPCMQGENYMHTFR